MLILSVFIMKLIVSIHELSFPGLLPGYLIYLFQVVKTTPVGSGDEAGVRCVCDVQYYGASVRCFIQVSQRQGGIKHSHCLFFTSNS